MEEKNDMSRGVIIAIIILAIVALVGYFILNKSLKNDNDAIEDMVPDVMDENKSFDEVGSFMGTETYGEKESGANIELVLNDDKTATLVLVYDETKKYEGTYTKKDNEITFTSNSSVNTDTNNMENYNTNDNLNMTEEDDASDTNAPKENDDSDTNSPEENDKTKEDTFVFTVSDGSLYYHSQETNEKIKMNKVSKNDLNYINE